MACILKFKLVKIPLAGILIANWSDIEINRPIDNIMCLASKNLLSAANTKDAADYCRIRACDFGTLCKKLLLNDLDSPKVMGVQLILPWIANEMRLICD